MSFTALVKKKTNHYTENLIAKLQNSEQNYRLSWVNLIGPGFEQPSPGVRLLGLIKSIYYH